MPIIDILIGTLSNIWNSVKEPLQSVLNWFSEQLPKITEWVNGVIDVIGGLIDAIKEFLGLNNQAQTEAVFNTAANPAAAVNPANVPNMFGRANGLPYVPREMPVMVHRGERILTERENQEYSNGQNGTTNNITMNFPNVQTQSQADENARMYVNALRNSGVDI